MTVYLIDSVIAKEEAFAKDLKDSNGKKFTEISPVFAKAKALTLKKPNWYFKDKYKKTKIVLHFTVGNILSDIATLTTNTVSVAYVVARSGQVYELFNPDYWAYHLGPTATGGNIIQGRQSIAIEISNYGPLIESGETLNTVYKTPYCLKSQSEHYTVASHRGYNCFCNFTDKQYESLASLLKFLTEKYEIPYKIPGESQQSMFFKTDPGTGIWSHQNYRQDKADVGPAFDWNRIK